MKSDFRMFSGLTPLARTYPRIPKEEFITYHDPYIWEALQAVISPGELDLLHNWSKSYYTLSGHLESIHKYGTPKATVPPSNASWAYIISSGKTYFSKLPRVTALSAKTDFDIVNYHQSTSAGYGYNDPTSEHPTHKGIPNGPNHKRAKRIASKIVHDTTTAHRNDNFRQYIDELPNNSTPDVSFTRTQLVERPLMKVRNVFGECFHYVLLEGLFAQPLIQTFMQIDSFYYIGADPLFDVPRYINQINEDDDPKYVTLDWSSFDATVHPYEIELAFDLIESMIIYPDQETELMFKYVRRLFLKRKLASPDGTIYMRFGGIPSGSYFTHIVDSIINWNRIRYLFHRIDVPIKSIITHGDDSLIVITATFHSLLPLVSESTPLGWILKPEKIALVPDKSELEFLGRSVRNGVNYRDPIKSFRLLVYTEYEVTDPQISIARLKSINNDSGLTLPHFEAVYHYLRGKYDDQNLPLPRFFRKFKQPDLLVNVPLGI